MSNATQRAHNDPSSLGNEITKTYVLMIATQFFKDLAKIIDLYDADVCRSDELGCASCIQTVYATVYANENKR